MLEPIPNAPDQKRRRRRRKTNQNNPEQDNLLSLLSQLQQENGQPRRRRRREDGGTGGQGDEVTRRRGERENLSHSPSLPTPSPTPIKTLIEQQRPQIKTVATEIAADAAEKFFNNFLSTQLLSALPQEYLDIRQADLAREIESNLKSKFFWELQQLGLEVQNLSTQDEAS